MKNLLRDILGTIGLAVAIFLIIHATLQNFIVVGPSMEISFHDGERLLVVKSRLTYAFHEPERGDVIVFQPPSNSKRDFIKRTIGLPGDEIEIKDREVYVNGTALDEPYINDSPSYTYPLTEVPEGQYFVLGDNRNISNDSHNGWMVPRKNIIGKAWLLIWPPGYWGLVPDYSLGEQLK